MQEEFGKRKQMATNKQTDRQIFLSTTSKALHQIVGQEAESKGCPDLLAPPEWLFCSSASEPKYKYLFKSN